MSWMKFGELRPGDLVSGPGRRLSSPNTFLVTRVARHSGAVQIVILTAYYCSARWPRSVSIRYNAEQAIMSRNVYRRGKLIWSSDKAQRLNVLTSVRGCDV